MKKTLADYYMITGKFADQQEFAAKLEAALQSGNKVVQLHGNC